jgi:arylsulfatase
MHIVTHLSPKYEAMRNSENGWSIHEAGMAQLDDVVGGVLKYLKDNGLEENTIVVFTTDNGTENFTWPDGGQTPFKAGKGTTYEGGFRAPGITSLARSCTCRKSREWNFLRIRLVADFSCRSR